MKNILVALLIISMLGNGKEAVAATTSNSIESDLINWTNTVRKSLPMMVNNELQATNIAAVGKVLMNRYNFLKKKTDFYNLDILKTEYYNNARNSACTNPDNRQLINVGVSIQYEYYDRDNVFIMKYLIDKNVCKANGL